MKILKHFVVGFLLGPGIVLGVLTLALFLFEMRQDTELQLRDFTGYPWRIFFAIGILSSLWMQFVVKEYFDEKGYSDSVVFSRKIKRLNEVMQVLMVISVFGALATIKVYIFHIWITVAYMLLISVWDLIIWLWSGASQGKEKPHEDFQNCCKQLFLHVDLVVLLVVTTYVLALPFLISRMYHDYDTFSFWSEISRSRSHGDEFVKHDLVEPLMGGVIGFHALFSVMLLMFHLGEWEWPSIGRRESKLPPPADPKTILTTGDSATTQ